MQVRMGRLAWTLDGWAEEGGVGEHPVGGEWLSWGIPSRRGVAELGEEWPSWYLPSRRGLVEVRYAYIGILHAFV